MILHQEAGKLATKRFKTLEEDFNRVHNNKYNYELVVYINSKTKINIVCLEHGEFQQTPNSHLNGNGCHVCARKQSTVNNNTCSRENYFKLFKDIHGDKFDYSESKYISHNKPIQIKCNTCLMYFMQQPQVHKISTLPCPHCRVMNTDKFITQSNIVHNNKYNYAKSVYTHIHDKIIIVCESHGEFNQQAASHLNGNGCPQCSFERTNYQRYKDRKTVLYYITIGDYFKIGLTQSNIYKRFYREVNNNVSIKLVHEWVFEDGWEAYLIEQEILTATKHLQVNHDDLEGVLKDGKTEVRKTDIIDVIYKYLN